MKPFKRVQKYGAKPTNGYASKREAEYAEQLRLQKLDGFVSYWLEQVPIKLGGGNKYVCDFLVFFADGSYQYVEVKGVQTPVWKNKMRQLEHERPEVFAKLEVVR